MEPTTALYIASGFLSASRMNRAGRIAKQEAALTARRIKTQAKQRALIKLQEHKYWRTPKGLKGKKEVLSIRADMVLMLSTLYDFIERAKIDGKMKNKDISINNFIDNKLTEKVRKTWYGGISGASTGIIGALRIIAQHNEHPQSTTIGPDLLKKYGLVDPIVYKSK